MNKTAAQIIAETDERIRHLQEPEQVDLLDCLYVPGKPYSGRDPSVNEGFEDEGGLVSSIAQVRTASDHYDMDYFRGAVFSGSNTSRPDHYGNVRSRVWDNVVAYGDGFNSRLDGVLMLRVHDDMVGEDRHLNVGTFSGECTLDHGSLAGETITFENGTPDRDPSQE